VHPADPRPIDRNAAAAQGDRPALVAVPNRGPVTGVLVTSASIIALITGNPAPTARASRPSRMFPAISAIATVTCSGTVNPCAPGASRVDF